MSVTVPYSAKVTGSTGTTSTASITAPTVGNTLLVMVTVPAGATGVSLTDNLANTYTQDFTASGLYGSIEHYFFRKSNIANQPTSLSATSSTSMTSIFEVIECAGMANTSPLVSTFGKTSLSGGASQTTHVASFTTTNSNDFVMLGSNTSNARNLSSATSVSMTVVAPETVGSNPHLCYLADAGAAGGYSTTLTFSAATASYALGVIYKAAKPAVTSVSSPTATEGSNVVFTVTLASAPSSTTGYTGVLAASGTYPANLGADLSNTLATATLSNGVTFSAGSFSVPSGVSSWTVTIGTVDDALDEYDETFTLTVDGTQSGTGTITDNDPLPNLTIGDATESFGVVTFPISINTPSGRDLTFNVSTVNGSRTAGVDFTGLTNVPVTITAGNTTATVAVTVL